MAERLVQLGVSADTLFFRADREPALGHEYQFNLDIPQGVGAFVAFLRRAIPGTSRPLRGSHPPSGPMSDAYG